MKTIKKELVIEKLIESRIDTCMTDPFYLYEILKNISGWRPQARSSELVGVSYYRLNEY